MEFYFNCSDKVLDFSDAGYGSVKKQNAFTFRKEKTKYVCF